MDESAFDRLLEILRAASKLPGGHCGLTAGEFSYRWQTETEPGHSPAFRVWAAGDGTDRGFAWLSDGQLHIVSLADDPRQFQEMLRWAEETLHTVSGNRSIRIPVDERASNLQQIVALHSYRPAEPVLVRRSRKVDSIPDPLQIPSTYQIGSVDGTGLKGWATAYRQAFAPEEMTLERRRAVNHSPLYRPDLDLIVRDSRGAIAAFALVWFDGDAGTFEPVGCRPADQRQGLSRALMREGLVRLGTMGARIAYVTTTQGRHAANRLYESLGFQGESSYRTWARLD